MPTYYAHLKQNCNITPAAHVFHILVFHYQDPPSQQDRIYVLEHTFEKAPAETWPQAQARCRQEIADAIAQYEHELQLSAVATTWLQSQTWDT